jgi:hypothetical protein
MVCRDPLCRGLSTALRPLPAVMAVPHCPTCEAVPGEQDATLEPVAMGPVTRTQVGAQ